MHVKVLNSYSNKSFDMLLELLKAAFPMCTTTISSSFYEGKQNLHDLGMDTRLFMRVSTIVYCTGRNLAICKITQRVVSLNTMLLLTKGNKFAQGIVPLSVDTEITVLFCITRGHV